MGRIARRAAAASALGFGAGVVVLAAFLAVERFPRGLAVLAGLLVALAAGWTALRSEGPRRVLAAGLTAAGLAGAALALVLLGSALVDLVVVALVVGAVLCARAAFRLHVELPAAPRPRRPVLFFNPRSGGGKAVSLHLEDEARARGIAPVELGPGRDLRELVEEAVAAGADALAMAGGDGSQAVVAEIAARRGLPYACVPAGTRNHFALDLGVDRDDVVGALDAFVAGGERRVDLATVNGRVFVNNVSIGLYANAVRRPAYRDAKLRTLAAMAPEALGGGGGGGTALRWRGPGGEEGHDAVALLVSNNSYRLGMGLGSGTRPRLDAGVLGVTTAEVAAGGRHGVDLHRWCCRDFEIEADGPVAAGIDGEAATLKAPIRFASMPGALSVRIARDHPGASPSAEVPPTLRGTVVELARLAIGAEDTAAGGARETIRKQREERPDGHLRGRAT
ncbi:MAG TPA: diacylglycerol kinase family protein [Solirubrobacterales bacterium]|nr:diacylglycerol kinase family protein [Solirubrobacterales bacterium]